MSEHVIEAIQQTSTQLMQWASDIISVQLPITFLDTETINPNLSKTLILTLKRN